MKKVIFTMVLAAVLTTVANAQVKVGPNPQSIDASAMLQVDAAATGNRAGFLTPRVTLTATNLAAPCATHVAGMVVYNTATASTGSTLVTPGFYYNDGFRWVRMVDEKNPPALTAGSFITIPVTTNSTVVDLSASSYYGKFVIISGPPSVIGTEIKLPVPTAADAGKSLYIVAIGGTVVNLTNQNLSSYQTNTYSSMQQYGCQFVTDGTNWYAIGGQ